MCSGLWLPSTQSVHGMRRAQGHTGSGHGMTGEECPGMIRRWRHADASYYTLFRAAKGTFVFKPESLQNKPGLAFNKAILGRPSDPMDPMCPPGGAQG